MKKQLLFIDDNPIMGGFLKHMFGKKHDVIWCTNAEDALAWLHQRNVPDLIISDYELTGMNGLSFLNQVKKTGFYKDIPVIMLSGRSTSSDRIECLEAGAEDYVIKPFNPTELGLKVNRYLSAVVK